MSQFSAVYVRGSFCEKTRSAVRRLLYENAVASWYHPHTSVVIANPMSRDVT